MINSQVLLVLPELEGWCLAWPQATGNINVSLPMGANHSSPILPQPLSLGLLLAAPTASLGRGSVGPLPIWFPSHSPSSSLQLVPEALSSAPARPLCSHPLALSCYTSKTIIHKTLIQSLDPVQDICGNITSLGLLLQPWICSICCHLSLLVDQKSSALWFVVT